MKKKSSVYPVWIILTVTFVVIVLIFLLFFLFYFKTEKIAKGFEDEVFVVADSIEYEQLVGSLKSVFEKEISTPQPEKLFTLKRIDISQLEKNKRIKNLIIAASLNSGNSTSKYIEKVVDADELLKIKSDSNFISYKDDLWAQNQLVAIISAPTINQLTKKILIKSEDLLYAFQKKSDERLFSNLYNPATEQEDIEGKLLRDYGWIIYAQVDFKLVVNNPKEKFVLLKKSVESDFEQWISVYWIDNATPDYLTQDSIEIIRNRLTKKFYQTTDDSSYVFVAVNDFVLKEINFNGRYALFTQGLWELNIKGVGGPFVNYFFYDEKTQRIYMIDGSVYAPKYYKRNLIQQMDVTLQSFRTEAELSKERKEDLLDAVKD
jgi:hypothetical protein